VRLRQRVSKGGLKSQMQRDSKQVG
jgi:hypothetical protein